MTRHFQVDQVPVVAIERADRATAESHRVADDRREHRPDVGRRARDDVQDLAGRGLSRQRVSQAFLGAGSLGSLALRRLAGGRALGFDPGTSLILDAAASASPGLISWSATTG
jgi:hypothetical protein